MALFGRKKADLSDQQKTEEYLRTAAAKGGSKLFQDVVKAMEALEQEQKVPVSPESAQKVVLANAKLIKACEAYMGSRQGAATDKGKERLEAVTRLCEQRKEKNLDQMRDMREVNRHLGEKWEDVKVSIPVIELKSGGEVVGNNVNKRVKTSYNGKMGFFTERKELLLWQDEMAQMIGREKDSRRKDIYERNKEWLEKKLAPVGQDSNPFQVLNNQEFPMRLHLADTWQSMDMSDPQFGVLKELVGNIPDETAKALTGYQNEAKRLDEDQSLSAADREARKLEAFEAQVRRHIPQEYQQRLTAPEGGTRQFLIGLASSEPEKKKGHLELGVIRADLIEERARLNENTVEGAVRAVAINNFVRDEKVLRDCADTIRTLASADTASKVGNLDRGKTELTDRNVATSRIAELLGVGNIVAHSEKMIVKSGGKTMEGCFMEFAEGKDFSSTKEEDLRMLAENVEMSSNPSFAKDESAIGMLDFLCGQMDRNPGNMFYKLGEPGPDGKRNVIGLQGIDNDLAFGFTGRGTDNLTGKEVDNEPQLKAQLARKHFIDKNMAEAIQKLDREKLEFALGDLISEDYIDMMWKRTKLAQEHIRENMVVVEGDGWKLDKFKMEDYIFSAKGAPKEKVDAVFKDYRSMGLPQAYDEGMYIDTEKLKELKTNAPEEFKYAVALWDKRMTEQPNQTVQHHAYNAVITKIRNARDDLAAIKARDERFMEDVAPAMEAMFDEGKAAKPARKEISFKDFAAGSQQARQPRRPRPQGPAIGVREKKGPVQEQVKGR